MNENVALAMRKTAEDANKEREQTSRIAAEQWVDAIVLDAIQKAAKRGEFYVDIQVPTNIHKVYATDYIKTGGFTVEPSRQHSRYIRISW